MLLPEYRCVCRQAPGVAATVITYVTEMQLVNLIANSQDDAIACSDIAEILRAEMKGLGRLVKVFTAALCCYRQSW